MIAVIAGYSVWTVLWLGGNALLFCAAAGAGERFIAPGPLAGLIVSGFLCSVAAGLQPQACAEMPPVCPISHRYNAARHRRCGRGRALAPDARLAPPDILSPDRTGGRNEPQARHAGQIMIDAP